MIAFRIFLFCVLVALASASRMMTMMSKIVGGKSPVFVAGGSRGTGLEVIKRLSASGTPVRALVRTSEGKSAIEKIPGVTVFVGDASDAEIVQKSMENCVAAITTLGGKIGGKRIDYIGNSNVVEQAGILGIERIILLSSIGCGETKKAISASVYSVLEETLKEKDLAERDLRTYTNLDWTIIRPGGLKSELPTGKAILTEDVLASGVVNRSDVADLIVKTLDSKKSTRKELSCIDPSQASSFESFQNAKPFEL